MSTVTKPYAVLYNQCQKRGALNRSKQVRKTILSMITIVIQFSPWQAEYHTPGHPHTLTTDRSIANDSKNNMYDSFRTPAIGILDLHHHLGNFVPIDYMFFFFHFPRLTGCGGGPAVLLKSFVAVACSQRRNLLALKCWCLNSLVTPLPPLSSP